MNVKELKTFIKDLPDDMPIKYMDELSYMTEEISLRIDKKKNGYSKDMIIIYSQNIV